MTTERRIVGPPGTGKTTTLSGLIGTACRDFGSEAVLVSSFTRAAARELVSRNLPLDEEQVGTLHALCYRALGRPKIATGSILKDWNDSHPTRAFGGIRGADLDDPYNTDTSDDKDGDKLLQELNRLRGLRIDRELWPMRVESFAADWEDFKANTGTVDFTDLIDTCVREQVPIPFDAKVMFLDEVQDFSVLELALARHWGSQCEEFWLVGDEDQTLYTFKGATPDAFLKPDLPADCVRVLGQSHRVPRAVHAAACAWIEQCSERMPKEYKPRPVDGEVDTRGFTYKYPNPVRSELEDWIAAGKTVAFLGSCSFFVDPIKRCLREWGIPFHNPYRLSRGDWNPLTGKAGTVSAADRVLAYLQVSREGRWWTYADLWKWTAALEADELFTHGAKTEMRRKAEDNETAGKLVETADLDRWFADQSIGQHAASGDLAPLRRYALKSYDKPLSYALNIAEANGMESLKKRPQTLIGTVHSVKGGEADIVVLFPDLSPAGYREWMTPGEAKDSVRRCFYVGMTRAKEALYWAHPNGPAIGGYL